MKISGTRIGIAAAVVAASVGAVVALTVMPGLARSGAPVPAVGSTASPVPSIVVPTGVPTNVPPTAVPPVLTLEVASSAQYGPILVTPAGLTVYRSVRGCACEPGYRPLLAVPGQPLRLPVLVHGRLGTLTRADDTQQVTYNGAPLFVFTGDHVQGDTNGVSGNWQVIATNP